MGGGLRTRKNDLIVALKVRACGAKLTPEQVDTFELLYRRACSMRQQDEITRAIDLLINGWKTDTDSYSRILRAAGDLDELGDDDDSPAMKAGLARSQMSFLRKAV